MLAREIVTLHVRPLLDSFEMETSIILPTGSFDELSSDFLASLKDKKPETSGIPRLSMYPWSSILLTEADMVYTCMSETAHKTGAPFTHKSRLQVRFYHSLVHQLRGETQFNSAASLFDIIPRSPCSSSRFCRTGSVGGNYNATQILARPEKIEQVGQTGSFRICVFSLFVAGRWFIVHIHRLQSGCELRRDLSNWDMTI
jgi:hypothetical protein